MRLRALWPNKEGYDDHGRHERIKELRSQIDQLSRGPNTPLARRMRLKKIKPIAEEIEAHQDALDPTRMSAIARNSTLVKTPSGGYEVHHGGASIGSLEPVKFIDFKTVNGGQQMASKTGFNAKYGDRVVSGNVTRQQGLQAIAGAHMDKIRGRSLAEADDIRNYHLRVAGYPVRTAMYDGRSHLVVPVIALRQGVIHAVNADVPEYVGTAALVKAAKSWNGRALVIGHPIRDGRQCSADETGVWDERGFGIIQAAHVKGHNLSMEAWVDPKRLEALGQHDLLTRLRDGKQIEVSVGAHVRTLDKSGEYEGRKYKAEWGEIVGDHLAFLPTGRGACSLEMGCGAHRAASAILESEAEFRAAWPNKVGFDDHGRGNKVEHLGGVAGRLVDDHGNVTKLIINHPTDLDLSYHYTKHGEDWHHIESIRRQWGSGSSFSVESKGTGKVSPELQAQLNKVKPEHLNKRLHVRSLGDDAEMRALWPNKAGYDDHGRDPNHPKDVFDEAGHPSSDIHPFGVEMHHDGLTTAVSTHPSRKDAAVFIREAKASHPMKVIEREKSPAAKAAYKKQWGPHEPGTIVIGQTPGHDKYGQKGKVLYQGKINKEEYRVDFGHPGGAALVHRTHIRALGDDDIELRALWPNKEGIDYHGREESQAARQAALEAEAMSDTASKTGGRSDHQMASMAHAAAARAHLGAMDKVTSVTLKHEHGQAAQEHQTISDQHRLEVHRLIDASISKASRGDLHPEAREHISLRRKHGDDSEEVKAHWGTMSAEGRKNALEYHALPAAVRRYVRKAHDYGEGSAPVMKLWPSMKQADKMSYYSFQRKFKTAEEFKEFSEAMDFRAAWPNKAGVDDHGRGPKVFGEGATGGADDDPNHGEGEDDPNHGMRQGRVKGEPTGKFSHPTPANVKATHRDGVVHYEGPGGHYSVKEGLSGLKAVVNENGYASSPFHSRHISLTKAHNEAKRLASTMPGYYTGKNSKGESYFDKMGKDDFHPESGPTRKYWVEKGKVKSKGIHGLPISRGLEEGGKVGFRTLWPNKAGVDNHGRGATSDRDPDVGSFPAAGTKVVIHDPGKPHHGKTGYVTSSYDLPKDVGGRHHSISSVPGGADKHGNTIGKSVGNFPTANVKLHDLPESGHYTNPKSRVSHEASVTKIIDGSSEGAGGFTHKVIERKGRTTNVTLHKSKEDAHSTAKELTEPKSKGLRHDYNEGAAKQDSKKAIKRRKESAHDWAKRTGLLKNAASAMEDCPACEGSGNKDGNPCTVCDGEGEIRAAETVEEFDNNDDGGLDSAGEETFMTQDERNATIKALAACECSGFKGDAETLDLLEDDRLMALAAATDAREKAIAEVATLKAAAEKPKTMTVDEFMAVAPPELKTLIESKKAEDATLHAALVGKLKTAQSAYTEDELKTLTLPVLRKLASVAKVDEPIADFSGLGMPRALTQPKDMTVPPNPYEAGIKALQAANTKH